MDMRKLEFKPETFNGLWACVSLLHIPKKECLKTLQGFNRVLKKNGLLYVSVKKGEGEKMIAKDYFKNNEKKFFAFYTENEITELTRKAGFKIISVTITEKKDSYINIFAEK